MICVEYVKKGILAAAIYEFNKILIIDRKIGAIIKRIEGFDGCYNVLQRVIGFKKHFPYLIVKDTNNIYVINTINMEIQQQIECKFDTFSHKDSLL